MLASFFDGLVRTIPHTGFIGALTAYTRTREKFWLYYMTSYLLSTEILSHLLKRLFSATLPRRLTRRPGDFGKGACGHRSNGVCTSCSVYATAGTRSKTPGMFSGHAASVFFNLVFFGLHAAMRPNFKRKEDTIFLSLLGFAAALVSYNRVATKCHSILQVFVGACVGTTMAAVSYVLLHKLEPEIFQYRNLFEGIRTPFEKMAPESDLLTRESDFVIKTTSKKPYVGDGSYGFKKQGEEMDNDDVPLRSFYETEPKARRSV